MSPRRVTLSLTALLSLGILAVMAADPPPVPRLPGEAKQQFDEGNWREAFESYKRRCLDENSRGKALAEDFSKAVQSLQRLQQQHEIDAFRDEVVDLHSDDWRLLVAAAESYRNGPAYGFIVGGEFRRGNQRGGGQYVSSEERDRVQALRLMDQARQLIDAADITAAEKADFFRQLGTFVLWQRDGNEAWRLQDLTDLSELPDYEEAHRFGWWGGSSSQPGAPVDEQGDPVYYSVPESWGAASSDGQRWRWCLEQVAKNDPGRRDEIDFEFAQFLRSQFGVQTMQQWGVLLRDDDEGDNQSGPYAVHTLSENETIARLATGVKRFDLPDEFNFLKIYQRLAAKEQGSYAEASLRELAQIFEDRQQYPKAAKLWQENIRRFRDDRNATKQQRLDQIVGSWGRFEPAHSQPARTGATVDFRFRNGKRVEFTAHAIKVEQLIADVKAYLKGSPQQLDWQQTQIDNLGYRLVQENEQKYVGEQVAQWTVDLEPRAAHFDRRITITTPLQQAGAYLLVGKMADGNVSRIVLWVSDTAITKKPLDGKSLYFVADAVTGEPIAGANVEFFGWRQERVPNTKRDFHIITKNFAERSDADGQIVTDPRLMPDDLQWLAIARTKDGRFAHLGFNGVWFGRRQHPTYDQRKAILITDRPVYRPDQTVEFKIWLREASYQLGDVSQFAGTDVEVRIADPQGTEVWKQTLRTDEYGGAVAQYELPDDAKLGNYSLAIVNQPGIGGGGSFRVEEYKKPEFEVLVEAPDKPVALGETIMATIRAKYYFGAPVTNATVKYKVERSPHEARWYPHRPWDWLYGEGYWWFTPDAYWYPGFARWGCFAPRPFWHHWSPDPPELVIDREVEIGPDGTVEVEIDTELAKLLHGDQDHKYTITAEVVDASRRTIVGAGNVLVAREPFKVFVWTDRGHYRVGDTIQAHFNARTLDGQGVEGEGTLKLLKVTYDEQGKPVEELAQQWDLNTDEDGQAEIDIKASAGGQYRLAYSVTDGEVHTIEGGQLLVIRGEGFDGSQFQFNDLELIADKPEYKPGESVNLLINTNRVGSTVLLFVKPEGGIYAGPPQVLRLEGKSTTVEVPVAQGDMPNFFIEAMTIAGGDVHTVVQQIVVPPEKRVLNVEVKPDAEDYQPGAAANVTLKLTDIDGNPFVGSLVMSMYDRAVEYISGGSNVPEIREYFWKWTRNHHPQTEHNLERWVGNLLKSGETPMGNLGVFGEIVTELDGKNETPASGRMLQKGMRGFGGGAPMPAAAPMMEMAAEGANLALGDAAGGEAGGAMVEPTVRTQFADTAFWKGDITTDADGLAKVSLTMPENLTDWKVRSWAMGHGTRVGEGQTTVTTSKNLLVRLQAPRFFTETDEVVLSAIVHNYLPTEKQAQVELVLEGGTLELLASRGRQSPDDGDDQEGRDSRDGRIRGLTPTARLVTIPAGGEVRVDWKVKAVAEGDAVVTMKALTDEESDAMQMTFPVYVHGMLKTESYSGVIRPEGQEGKIEISVPADRRINESRLEIRYSPTLAGAMVDALPYLASYPYGCTEQTLNRFLPTVITQKILQQMGLDLAAIRDKRTNLNAQEIGDAAERAAQWKRFDHNPVFDEAEVARMVKKGVADLTAMQLSDGGWGWFSGYGEHSGPHTTVTVVHGLKLAQENDVALVPGVLERGVEWLARYQDKQVGLLLEGERRAKLEGEALRNHRLQYKQQASNIDALVFSVLVENDRFDETMQRILYRDRLQLSQYSQALLGLALHEIGADEQRDMVIRNLDQFLKVDNENQTAYLDLPNNGYWWFWYGDTIEANAAYLRLLTRVDPQSEKAAGLVKYLLNNRKHGTYWNSTRDTAYCIESLAEYLVASGEAEPNMTIEVWIDGEQKKQVQVTPETLFSFDGTFVLTGDAIETGPHTIELKKRGEGPLYYNAYLTNFTTEEFIEAAGLEIKVERDYYRLVQREDATDVVAGSRGQVIDQQALKYDRVPLRNLAEVRSGDLIEIELTIDSKNDYEYVVFEDLKAAGCEPVTLQSGYTKGGLGAYVEFRDERVAFFLRQLDRGQHSVSYRLRAEIPGQFSALPTRAHAMYAPELRANSDEMKLRIADREE